MSVFSPAVTTRHFRSLVFDPSLEVILELGPYQKTSPLDADIASITYSAGVDLEAIRKFLEKRTAQTYIGPCLHIDLAAMQLKIKGYPLADNIIIASSISPNDIILPIDFPKERLIQTVEYFYHMAKVL